MHKNQLMQLEDVDVSELAFASYDIDKLQVLPILFQTGYLTIKSREEFGLYRLGSPNQEVEASMELLGINFSSKQKTVDDWVSAIGG